MEQYRVNESSVRSFASAINQSGGSYTIDKYIYGNQSGAGIGSFLIRAFKSVLPLAKSVARIAKPHIQKLGTELLQQGTSAATKGLVNLSDQAIQKINKKRRVDNLDVVEEHNS